MARKKSDFVDYVVNDLLGAMHGVTSRAMFGEHCLYLDGAIFALVSDDAVYFKADDGNRAKFEAAGSRRYTYVSGGKAVSMPYWEVPADVLEDRHEVALWAEESSRVTRREKPNKC